MSATRRIVMFNRVSADGYFVDEKGGLDWAVPDDQLDKEAAEGMPHTDTILFGRRTYEMFASFWPTVLEDPGAATDPHSAGRKPPGMVAMARWIHDATKWVFSSTLTRAPWNGTVLHAKLDPREIEALKSGPGKGIILFGSGTVVSQLSEHRLIDEYRFVVSPVLLGRGRSLLSDAAARLKLELKETRRYPSGNVMLCYAPGAR